MLLGALLLFFVAAFPHSVAAGPNLSSPEATVRAFLAAFGKGDSRTAVACIAGAQPSALSADLGRQIKQAPVALTAEDVRAETHGDAATVMLSVQGVPTNDPGDRMRSQERVSLRREASGWKIMPVARSEFRPGQGGIIANLVTVLANPQVGQAARRRASEVSCLSNLKQIGTGAMMFVQDHDERFALKAPTYKASLMPYIRNERVFQCPDDPAGKTSYALNRNLAGVSLARLKSPAQTVLIYEGANQRLTFRHDNKAAVCFADGHARLVTREQARTLRWTP